MACVSIANGVRVASLRPSIHSSCQGPRIHNDQLITKEDFFV